MDKRIIDLTAEELDRLAGEAWFEASSAALQQPIFLNVRYSTLRKY